MANIAGRQTRRWRIVWLKKPDSLSLSLSLMGYDLATGLRSACLLQDWDRYRLIIHDRPRCLVMSPSPRRAEQYCKQRVQVVVVVIVGKVKRQRRGLLSMAK
ncbi:hypothetical protein LX36DRAFT_664204 [Colletotrichum falcatum]|nr:hypothetical protein LX36DRAFT_664204 [Colletotrichum falcatum]